MRIVLVVAALLCDGIYLRGSNRDGRLLMESTMTPKVALARQSNVPAGGHKSQISVNESSGKVHKLFKLDDPKSSREKSFYDWMADNKMHCLNGFLPGYHGVGNFTLGDDIQEQEYIELDAVTSNFIYANVLDIKMGTQIYHSSATLLKKIRQSLYWPQLVMGFSINGYKVWDAKETKYRESKKVHLKTLLTLQLVLVELDLFFDTILQRTCKFAHFLEKKLGELRTCVANQGLEKWEFKGSSILVTYEGDPQEANNCIFGVHAIDFAYAERANPGSTFVEGYEKGLVTLGGYLEKKNPATEKPTRFQNIGDDA
eukprot:GEMP01064925.1.p1 GENE.GEMP01064925.1~~GEMP01064925.1.p1  ORF type:complete len:314 (+),score=63.03 GEMP01064925.1:96-1037(+)